MIFLSFVVKLRRLLYNKPIIRYVSVRITVWGVLWVQRTKYQKKSRGNELRIARWMLIVMNTVMAAAATFAICMYYTNHMRLRLLKKIESASVLKKAEMENLTQVMQRESGQLMFTLALSIAGVFVVLILLELMIAQLITNWLTVRVDALRNKAQFDQLTNTMNKKTFEERVRELLDERAENDLQAFIMVDVDDFKHVNDSRGHNEGDEVLMQVGQKLKEIFRVSDVCGRLGGDEFAVFLNCSGILLEVDEFLARKAIRLKDTMAKIPLDPEGRSHVTLSIGIAKYDSSMSGFEELYAKADKALYQSKTSGKDTFTIYREEMEECIDGTADTQTESALQGDASAELSGKV